MTVVTVQIGVRYRLDKCLAASYIRVMPTTGMELRVARTRAGLTMTELAARMGLSRQTLWADERAATVDPERARRYLEAVAALVDAKETTGGRAA